MKRHITLQQIIAAMVGIFCVSIGVAFNNCAGWGNDAIGLLYDGIRVAFGMTSDQLGIASNVVNIALNIPSIIFFTLTPTFYVNFSTIR